MKTHLPPELTGKKANQRFTCWVGFIQGRRSGRYETGAVMPMTIIALVALIGIAGLVVDFAPVYLDKNQLQHAADAAALAAEEFAKTNSSATEADIIQVAKNVFDKLKPEGASALQAQHVEVQGEGTQEPSVEITISSSRDTALTRVLQGVPDSLTVTANAVAKQKLDDAVQACISPMVICSDTNYEVGKKYPFTVGTDLQFLCEDPDPNNPNATANCNDLDQRMAKGTYPFGGGVYNVGTSGAYCYKIPGKTTKGHKVGQYRGGLNSRFFNCGTGGSLPEPGAVSGYTSNCTKGYPRDKVSWTGFKIDSQSNNIGDLTYKEYAAMSGSKDLWGCTQDWKTGTDCRTTGSGKWVRVNENVAVNRRTFIVAQVPQSACSSGSVEIDSSKVKVLCWFLREPVPANNDGKVYGEITNADCGGLATSGVGASRKFNTRLFD